ncbi:D-ribose pyranase [soil metagenome]
MKKTTLLHGELSHLIATLCHGDALVIADAGLPVPPGTRCVDLALMRGVPSFDQVLQAVLAEMQVERATCALEMEANSPQCATRLAKQLGATPLAAVPHVDFKRLTTTARAIVRTGEFTPFANVILYSGVVF